MKNILLLISLFIILSQLSSAQGTLQVSNIGQVSTGSAPIGSDVWIAQLFYTGNNSGGYDLDSIQLLMDATSGSPGGFSVSIYGLNSNGSLLPGSNLGSLSGSDPAGGGIFTYTASGLMLSPSTFYFVVLTTATPIAQGAYNWSAVNSPTINNDWEIYQDYCYSPNGLGWRSNSHQDVFQLAINATAIPEPSALSLLLLGGGVFLYVRTRKQQVNSTRQP
jgi:hypothetical protein